MALNVYGNLFHNEDVTNCADLHSGEFMSEHVVGGFVLLSSKDYWSSNNWVPALDTVSVCLFLLCVL